MCWVAETLTSISDVDDGSGSGRIRIHLGPWIRIQRYKMKGKAEFNQHFFLFFFGKKLYFSSLNPKKVANL